MNFDDAFVKLVIEFWVLNVVIFSGLLQVHFTGKTVLWQHSFSLTVGRSDNPVPIIPIYKSVFSESESGDSCVTSADCGPTRACQNLRCVDPCVGLCGTNANCQVRNHFPVCACKRGYSGDAFEHCERMAPVPTVTTSTTTTTTSTTTTTTTNTQQGTVEGHVLRITRKVGRQ